MRHCSLADHIPRVRAQYATVIHHISRCDICSKRWTILYLLDSQSRPRDPCPGPERFADMRVAGRLTEEEILEIHGHGGQSAKFDIEVSCGSAGREPLAIRFAGALARDLADDPTLSALSVSGEFARVYFRATQAATMQSPLWQGLHVELPLAVRKRPETRGLPAEGRRIAGYLASAMRRTLESQV